MLWRFIGYGGAIIVLAFIVVRIVYSGVYGRYGYNAYVTHYRQAQNLNENLLQIERDIVFYERKIKGLSPENPDLELLDQQLRKGMGRIGTNELIIE